MPAKKCKLVEFCTGHVIQDNRNSFILLYKFNIKLFLKKGKLDGHFLVTIKRKFDFNSNIHVL